MTARGQENRPAPPTMPPRSLPWAEQTEGGVVSVLAQGDTGPRPSQDALFGRSTLVRQDSLRPEAKCEAARGPGGASRGLSRDRQDPGRPSLRPPARGSRCLRPTDAPGAVLGTAGARLPVSNTARRLAPAPPPSAPSPASRTRHRPRGGQRNQNSNRATEAALCPEFLSFCSKVTIGIIFLQNDSCHDNQSKFSCSETDVSFS